MQVYRFDIAAYHAQTKDIGPADDLVYRRLIDLYYLTEGPLVADVERLAQSVDYDAEVVAGVLEEFFVLTPQGWRHEVLQKDIEERTKSLKKVGRPRRIVSDAP